MTLMSLSRGLTGNGTLFYHKFVLGVVSTRFSSMFFSTVAQNDIDPKALVSHPDSNALLDKNHPQHNRLTESIEQPTNQTHFSSFKPSASTETDPTARLVKQMKDLELSFHQLRLDVESILKKTHVNPNSLQSYSVKLNK